jgi:PKD repeat protein
VSLTFTVAAGTSGAAVRNAVADFGDGGSQSLGINGSTTATHVYLRDGTFTVTASATDSAGETTVVTTSFVVRALAPIAVTLAVSPTSPTVGSVTTFTATATNLSIGSTISRFEWDFGQGTTRTTPGNITTFVYGTAGRYIVTVRAVASDGATGSTQADMIVSGLVVTLIATPASPTVGGVVTFTAGVTTGVTILRYEWDFGQGSTRTTPGPGTTFVYNTADRYTVTVRAVAVDGANASARIDVVVSAGFVVSLTPSSWSPPNNTPVTFTVAVVPSSKVIARCEWNFGDGTTPLTTTGMSIASHTYAVTAVGNRTVTVRAVADDGTAATTSIVLAVQ